MTSPMLQTNPPPPPAGATDPWVSLAGADAVSLLHILERLGNTLPTPIFFKDLQGRYLGCNQAFAEMLGIHKEQIIGRTSCQILPEPVAAQHRWAEGRLLSCAEVQSFESFLTGQKGRREVIFHKSLLRNEQGLPTGIVGTLTDITERKQAERQVERLAYYDALTGLPNRIRMKQQLARLLSCAHQEKKPLGVLYLDQDRFKNINDTMGFTAGSKVLAALARKLSDFSVGLAGMEEALVARVGGDKFALIVYPLSGRQQLAAIAQQLLALLHESLTINGQEICCSGSIGAAISPEDGETVDMLMENADSAMYQAKRCGRNTWQFYSPEISLANLEQMTFETDLRQALRREELFLHYQPQYELSTGRLCGVEALLRWQHPRLGLVPPNRFIRVAEESGQIAAIGEWVLRTACAQSRSWQKQGLPPFTLAVNLSGQQLLQPQFSTLVKTILEESGLDPARLELELTESTIMKNPEDIRILRELKALGVQLAIDDFGTGYSSLSYLKRFPLNKIKIDRSFISQLTIDAEDAAIVEAILAMARSLGLTVLAEGVETQQQLDFLKLRQCNEVQGYFLSRPVAVEAIAALTGTMPASH